MTIDWARFGVAHARSPAVRSGHPCPPLTRRCLRSRPPGFAGHLRRLPGHGQPLTDSTTKNVNYDVLPVVCARQLVSGLAGGVCRCREARGASRGNVEWFPLKRRVFPQLALRASRQRRWGGRIGNRAASLALRGSGTTSQHAGRSGDAGKVELRDSLAHGVSRDVRVTPVGFLERRSLTVVPVPTGFFGGRRPPPVTRRSAAARARA